VLAASLPITRFAQGSGLSAGRRVVTTGSRLAHALTPLDTPLVVGFSDFALPPIQFVRIAAATFLPASDFPLASAGQDRQRRAA
jgi:hypothetical protein